MKRRNTAAKEEILNMLKTSNEAFSHESIQKKMANQRIEQLCYRILKSYCELGLVHKIIGDDGKQYFAYCNNRTFENEEHNHFYFRCTSYGIVECLEMEMKIEVPKRLQIGQVQRNYNRSLYPLLKLKKMNYIN